MNNSAGILCFRKKTDDIEFFVCSPGGIYWKNRTQWSFPKGHVENGETDLDAAFREFFEETGFPIREKINNEDLIDYGIIKQNRSKRVHLFVVEYADINPDSCVSNETMIEYLPKSGNLIKIKEIGKYAWLTYDSIKENGIEAYFPIYEDILNKKKKLKKL